LEAGASDNLSADASTFMVEMAEAACFLRDATPDRFSLPRAHVRVHALFCHAYDDRHSLVIVDELGRGTCPHEGSAIAAAALEQLALIGCRTLFATHYRWDNAAAD